VTGPLRSDSTSKIRKYSPPSTPASTPNLFLGLSGAARPRVNADGRLTTAHLGKRCTMGSKPRHSSRRNKADKSPSSAPKAKRSNPTDFSAVMGRFADGLSILATATQA
jgi:hypothetical protein